MREMVVKGLQMAVLVYGGLCLVLAGCQRDLMYLPERLTEAEALRRAAREGLEAWRNGAGEIIGWRPVREAEGGDVMLLFHGNAGNALHRGYFVQMFGSRMTVVLLEYPGYGSRKGRPSEADFVRAAGAALRQLRGERPGRIFLGGESLGTGVACRLAGEHPDEVAGVFLATPFSRLVDVARHHYPYLPVGWFLRDRYESRRHLQAYAGPVAFLLAGRDEVVPEALGRRLHDAYSGPKRLWVQPDRSHNTMDYAPESPWCREALDFLLERGE